MESVRMYGMNVRDLKQMLDTIPDNYKVSCNGLTNFWLNIDSRHSLVIIDTEMLIDTE